MMNNTTISFSILALTAALAVGCAGNTPTPEKADAKPMAKSETPAEAPTPTPIAEAPAVQPAAPIELKAADEPEKKFPYIELAGENKPTQRLFYFGFDKAKIDDNDRQVLKQHAEYLKQHPDVILHIQGHTDHYGPTAYNEYLSKQRAESVAKVLIEYGAPESQLAIDALGDSHPLNDVKNTAKNRRVELHYNKLEMVQSDQ
jgi:peptidoglycan-associated lipoprotein